MGKSALTWAWVKRDVLGQRLPEAVAGSEEDATKCRVPEAARPEGVFWWSFYENRSSFSGFLHDALKYVSNDEVDPEKLESDYDRAVALLDGLQQRRVLLVLDGFERELRGYASLSAAYQGDVVDPGERPRECCDPHAAGLLKAAAGLLTGDSAGRLLLTSRLFPRELDGLAGCLRGDLLEFTADDAEHFFRARGIRGTRAEFAGAWERYGRHPLTVSLLAGQVADDPDKPGDVSVAKDYDPVPSGSRKEGHVLELAYKALPEKARDLLSNVAAFRSPVEYRLLKAALPETSEREAKAAVKTLRERGMLLRQKSKDGARYDLHPVVRQYAYDRLTDKAGVHSRLRRYFSGVPDVDVQKIKSVDDLRPVIELYHHTVRAGLYEEAFKLYNDRLTDRLYFQLGSYQVFAELLAALFLDGEGQPPRLASKTDQSLVLNDLSSTYHVLGRARQAAGLLGRTARIDEEEDFKAGLAVRLSNLGIEQINLGELVPGECNCRRSIELSRELEDRHQEAIGHGEVGRALAFQAQFEEADGELRQSLRGFEHQGNAQGAGVGRSFHAQRCLLAGEPREALEAAQHALAFWKHDAEEDYPVERDRVRIEWLLGWSHTALAARAKRNRASHLTQAETHLSEALTRCRRIQLVDLEADILLALARWHRLKGDASEAAKLAQEALDIADRCEYRLQQADIRNFLAQLALDRKDRTAAREHAEIGRDSALCGEPAHNPVHCYKPALDEADRLLELCRVGGGPLIRYPWINPWAMIVAPDVRALVGLSRHHSTILTGTSYAVHAGHMVYAFCLLSRRCKGRCASTDARQGPSPGPFPRRRNLARTAWLPRTRLRAVSPLPGRLAIIDVDPRLEAVGYDLVHHVPVRRISRPLRGGQSGSSRFAGDHPVIESGAAVAVEIGSGRAQGPAPTTLRDVASRGLRQVSCVRMLA